MLLPLAGSSQLTNRRLQGLHNSRRGKSRGVSILALEVESCCRFIIVEALGNSLTWRLVGNPWGLELGEL
jgi:hypothetical protein